MTMDNKVIIKRINDWLECYQNKDNGFYNATALLKQYNEHYPNEQKLMKDFLRNRNTQNYIGSVLSNDESPKENYPDGKTQPNIFGMVENQQVTKRHSQVADNQIYGELSTNLKINKLEKPLLYIRKSRKEKQAGRSAEVYYFAPMLFSKFGTWLSPELERDIHKVLWNNVLEYRNELRRINPKLHDSIATIAGDDNNIYIKVHSMLNKAVFGRFEREGKQIDSGSENQLNMMKDIESEIIVLIKHNLITDYEQLKTHIQRYYL